MPLIFPENRTDYVGEIHFSSLNDSIPNGQDPAGLSTSVQRNAQALDATITDMATLFGVEEGQLNIPGVNSAIPNEKCILYMPQSLTFSDKATYNTQDLGMVGGAVEAGVITAKQGGSAGGVKSFIDGLKGQGGKDVGKLAIQNVVGAFGGDAISGALKSANKITSNPNTRALFESVPLRDFSFTFKMIPNNRQEAQNIREIIAFFRKELYPEEIPFGEGENSFSIGYRFPNKFRIKLYYGTGNAKREVGIKIKDCYLTSVNTVFNASSMGMHYDGSFTEVDLSLSFLEARALSRKDIIEEGFAGGSLDENGGSVEP